MVDYSKLYEIQKRLHEIPHEIAVKSDSLTMARARKKIAKAIYKREHAKIIMNEKTENPKATQTDLNSKADVGAFRWYCKMIRAESAFEKLKIQKQELRDEFDEMKEASWNFRATLKALKG